MSGQNKQHTLGIILTEEELELIHKVIALRIRAMQRKAKWNTMAQNMADSEEYVRLRKLESTIGIHRVVRRLASSPLGVPPRGARGLSQPPEDA